MKIRPRRPALGSRGGGRRGRSHALGEGARERLDLRPGVASRDGDDDVQTLAARRLYRALEVDPGQALAHLGAASTTAPNATPARSKSKIMRSGRSGRSIREPQGWISSAPICTRAMSPARCRGSPRTLQSRSGGLPGTPEPACRWKKHFSAGHGTAHRAKSGVGRYGAAPRGRPHGIVGQAPFADRLLGIRILSGLVSLTPSITRSSLTARRPADRRGTTAARVGASCSRVTGAAPCPLPAHELRAVPEAVRGAWS